MRPEGTRRLIVPGLRWWIIALLFGAAVLDYVDRQALWALAPTIQRDLGMDDRDDVVNVGRTRGMVEAMNAAGAAIQYTEYPGVGHNSWEKAYAETGLFEWMLAQRKP